MMNIDDTFLILLLIFQWFEIFICGEWGVSFIMLCETCQGTLIPALSGKPNSGTRPSDSVGHIVLNREVTGCHGPACPAVIGEVGGTSERINVIFLNHKTTK